MGYHVQNKKYSLFVGAAHSLGRIPHIHTHLELVYMREGEADAVLDNQVFRMKAGDLFLSFPNQIHSYEKSRDPRGFLLIVPLKPYLSIYSGVLLTKKPTEPVISVPEAQMEMLLVLLEFAYAEKESASETRDKDTDLLTEIPDTRCSISPAPQSAQGRHAGIVPA